MYKRDIYIQIRGGVASPIDFGCVDFHHIFVIATTAWVLMDAAFVWAHVLPAGSHKI